MITRNQKAALVFRMVSTSMRHEDADPVTDLEILTMAESWIRRSPDPAVGRDDLILGLVHILTGVLWEGARTAGKTREEAAYDVARLAHLIEETS